MSKQSLSPAQVRQVWALEELQGLESLLTEGRFNKFLKWQGQMELYLNEKIWDCKDWDEYKFICGQRDVVTKRFAPERMLQEIQILKDTLRDENKR